MEKTAQVCLVVLGILAGLVGVLLALTSMEAANAGRPIGAGLCLLSSALALGTVLVVSVRSRATP